MRVWLKPDRMRAYNISSEEVVNAIKDQKYYCPPGQLGISSGKKSQLLYTCLIMSAAITSLSSTKNIIIKSSGLVKWSSLRHCLRGAGQ